MGVSMEKGLRLVLITALISGVSVFVNGFGVAGMDAGLFTTLKNVIVAVFLLSAILLLKEWRSLKAVTRREWGSLVLIGLVGGSVPFLLFFTGLQMTSAAQGSLIQKTMFVFVAALAAVTLKEKIDKRMVIGGVLLVLGNLLVLRLTGFTFGAGDLLILAATLFWAGEIVLSKRLLMASKMPGRVVALGRMGFGSLFLLLYLIVTQKITLIAGLSQNSWIWIFVTSALLYGYVFTFYEGLKTVQASVATAVLLLGTVITTLLELAWTGIVSWPQLAGGALIIAGIILFLGNKNTLRLRTSTPG
jgi:drug/metabolite transporter (DMT)-like permease